METKKLILFAIPLCFLLIVSCKNNPEKRFYETGELREEITSLSNDSVHSATFTKDGKIIKQGKLFNNLREGYWEEFYEDGSVKWKGIYTNDKRMYEKMDFSNKDCDLVIEGNPTFLQKNQIYPFRVIVKGMHPEDIMVASDNGPTGVFENKDKYDYTLKPERADTLGLQIIIPTSGEMTVLCKILFEVKD